MIGIALLVPYIGGIVEFTLSIGAITGGPLLAPPIWALFSKRLTGKATLYITAISLGVNLFFKILLPLKDGYKLSRANEMLLGVGLPFLMLLAYELWALWRNRTSEQYLHLKEVRRSRKEAVLETSPEEVREVKRQNQFGLRVIGFSLAFIAVLLFILGLLSAESGTTVMIIAGIILLCALIPYRASTRVKLDPVPSPNPVQLSSLEQVQSN